MNKLSLLQFTIWIKIQGYILTDCPRLKLFSYVLSLAVIRILIDRASWRVNFYYACSYIFQ